MNRYTLIGFVLIGLVLFGFAWWNQPSQEQLEEYQRQQDSIALVQQQRAAADAQRAADADAAHKNALEMASADSTALFFPSLSGKAEDENNYEAQPIAPKQETVKAQKKFSLDIAPYSMIMLEYQL